jgi:hypothetical protein
MPTSTDPENVSMLIVGVGAVAVVVVVDVVDAVVPHAVTATAKNSTETSLPIHSLNAPNVADRRRL